MKKYPMINFRTTLEVLDGYGGLLTQYAREVFHFIFSMSKDQLIQELDKIPEGEVMSFYRNAVRTRVYVDEYSHNRWLAIPWRYKKHAQYLITLKLSEKLKQLEKEGVL